MSRVAPATTATMAGQVGNAERNAVFAALVARGGIRYHTAAQHGPIAQLVRAGDS